MPDYLMGDERVTLDEMAAFLEYCNSCIDVQDEEFDPEFQEFFQDDENEDGWDD